MMSPHASPPDRHRAFTPAHDGSSGLARESRAILELLDAAGEAICASLSMSERNSADWSVAIMTAPDPMVVRLGNHLARLAIERRLAERRGVSVSAIASAVRPVVWALRRMDCVHTRTVGLCAARERLAYTVLMADGGAPGSDVGDVGTSQRMVANRIRHAIR